MKNCNYISSVYGKDFYSSNKIWIIAYVADRCNYNCKYCYNCKPRTEKLLNLDVLERFLDNVHQRTHKNIDLELIGGEPTLHPHLHDFCKRLSSCQYISITVFTNLSQDVSFYSQLMKYDNLSIFASWHGIATDRQNLRFIEKAKKLDSRKITYCVMFENDNWSNSTYAFDSLLSICQNNVETSLIGKVSNEPYDYTQSQVSSYRSTICPKLDQRFNNKYTIECDDGNQCMTSFNDLYLNDDISFKNWKCDAGYNHLYIHVNGNAYPCQSYYDYKDAAITNICKQNAIDAMNFKPVICKFDTCSCTYDIKKVNLRTLRSHIKT